MPFDDDEHKIVAIINSNTNNDCQLRPVVRKSGRDLAGLQYGNNNNNNNNSNSNTNNNNTNNNIEF